MKAKDIQKILESFINESENFDYKSILIDGDWGCGKTYNLDLFLKHCREKYVNHLRSLNKNCKAKKFEKSDKIIGLNKDEKEVGIYYISLFGVDSVDDLYIKLNQAVKPQSLKGFNKAISYIKVFVKNIPDLGLTNGVVDELDYITGNQLKSTKKVKNKAGAIIIFDDIERIGQNLSYVSLLGFIYSLLLLGYRVVSAGSSANIKNYENLEIKTSFDDFKEKAFDRIYYIDEKDIDVFLEIFENDIDLGDETNVFNGTSKNLRVIQKAETLYKELMKHINELGPINVENQVSKYDLLQYCLDATKIMYEVQVSPDDINQYKNHSGFVVFLRNAHSTLPIELQCKIYKIFNSLNIKNDKGDVQKQTIINYVESLVSYLYTFSFDSFDRCVKQRSYNGEIDTRRLRLLSTENNINLSQKFLEKVESEEYKINNFDAMEQVRYFLYDTCLSVNDDVSDKIITAIYNTNQNFFLFYRRFESYFNKTNDPKKFDDIFTRATIKIMNGTATYLGNFFTSIVNEGDYDRLVDIIYYYLDQFRNEVTYNKDAYKIIGDALKSNNFFLPDLSKDFTPSEMRYFDQVSHFASICGVSDSLNKYLSNTYGDSNDLCVINRYNALYIS